MNWETFFEMLNKIVNELPGSWEEKRDLVKQKAEEYDAKIMFEEFTDWFEE